MAALSRHLRRISPGLRRQLFSRSRGICERQSCGAPITWDHFHVAHLRAASHGGPAVIENLEAWCVPCNLKNGNRDVFDTRVALRAWQRDALDRVLEPLTMQRLATVMAAPGSGKTVLAGAVFARGQDAGLWNRLLVLVPRVPLVKQWQRALLPECHIALDTHAAARQSGLELREMDGVCNTYQALLSPRVREGHRTALLNTATLVVLDEVHHLGQPVHDESNGGAAWAKAIRELVGDERTGLSAHVLNLSGTLFRTSPTERISTVQYDNVVGDHGEARIQARTNYEIHPEQLVREGLLRAPDLFRVGATVDIVDLKKAEITVSAIADLDDARVVLRGLNLKEEWVQELVKVTLDELQRRHRDTRNGPVKALIVTQRVEMARTFAKEVDRQMSARGLLPMAECVVSADGPDAYRKLENFRLRKRVGVLCAVGMAGEGYDCPEIAVVTYATNVLTAQYIRQVVARAQRVTPWEREAIGHPLTTAIILPDVKELVEQFVGILAPMVHEIEVPASSTISPEDQARGTSVPGWHDKELVGVADAQLDVVSAVSTTGTFDADPAIGETLAPALRAQNLPESIWPRVQAVIENFNQARPFEPPVQLGAAAVSRRPEPVSRGLTTREHHDVYRKRLDHAARWVAGVQGRDQVKHFRVEVYRQAGIRKLDTATPEQLKQACAAAMWRIRRHCEQTGTALPKWVHTEDGDR
jgi:superfamily II DNA or RNA helicase